MEGITKEEDDAIMRAKQRQVMMMLKTMMMMIVVTLQMFLDDVGVTIAMITVTLLAVVVVVLKVLLFSDKVQPTLSHLRVTANPPIAAGPERVHVLAAGAAGEVQHQVHGQGIHPV